MKRIFILLRDKAVTKLFLMALLTIKNKPAFLKKFVKENIPGHHFSSNPATRTKKQ